MATKKPKRTKIVVQSAEMKAARAGLVKSTQLAVAQNAARIGTASRGAVGAPRLRQSGSNLAAYDMGRYTDTLGNAPRVPPGGDGGSAGTGTGTGGRRRSTGLTADQKAAARRKKVSDKAAADYRKTATRVAAEKRKKAERTAAKAKADYLREAARKKARANANAVRAGKSNNAPRDMPRNF